MRYIFTLTAGRTGTNYLAALLASVPRVFAQHQPAPAFVLNSAGETYAQFWQRKLAAMAAACPAFASAHILTDHMVCHGFLDTFPLQADLIVLTRDARAIAKSMYALNAIPGTTRPNYPHPHDADRRHPYQLCYWYAREVERMQKATAEKWRAVGRLVTVTSIEDLKMGGLPGVCVALKLDAPQVTQNGLNTVVNARKSIKRVVGAPLLSNSQIETLEQEVDHEIRRH